MDALLQKHKAKHVYRVPEGLRELCSDIAREVLRSQPRNIYSFIADYMDALLITRENAKVAVRVVNNILLGSQTIVAILQRSGLNLEQVVRVAPRIQKAFRDYLDAVDARPTVIPEVCEAAVCEEECKKSLQSILQATGASMEQAVKAASIIQSAFRSHYEKMLHKASQGMVQWQQAAIRTLEILRKIRVSHTEASKAAITIQAAYRGYYTRKNLKLQEMQAAAAQGESEDLVNITKPGTVQRMNEMYDKESGVTLTRAHEAASIIQRAYRQYRQMKRNVNVSHDGSTKSMVTGAILRNLHENVFNKIMQRADIPAKFGNRKDLIKASNELQRTFNDRLTLARYEKKRKEKDSIERKVKDDTYSNSLAEDRMETEPKRDEGTVHAHVQN